MSKYELRENELFSLCNRLQAILHNRHIVLLMGDIGSGKTTLVRAFMESQGVQSPVPSPTFNLALCYECPQYSKIYHYDMYAKSLQDMLELGLLDMLDNDGLHFIEWGDWQLQQLLAQNGFNVISIHITPQEQQRIYEVSDE